MAVYRAICAIGVAFGFALLCCFALLAILPAITIALLRHFGEISHMPLPRTSTSGVSANNVSSAREKKSRCMCCTVPYHQERRALVPHTHTHTHTLL